MKFILPIILIVISALVIFFLWPTKYEPEDWNSFKEPSMPVEETIKRERPKEIKKEPEVAKIAVSPKSKGFAKQEEAEYFNNIRDIIKDQWEELEKCEADFDDKFAPLLKLGIEGRIRYLNDPVNLDIFLENITNFQGTTPSSAKMLKELAMPIASHIDGNEIMDTVGFIKTCRENQKRQLITTISYFLHKNKNAINAALTFLENEISTLTYPSILYSKVYELKSLLFALKIDESRYPELKSLEKIYNNYTDKDMRTARSASPFNPEIQKLSYEHALILQKEIQKTIKAVKRDLLK